MIDSVIAYFCNLVTPEIDTHITNSLLAGNRVVVTSLWEGNRKVNAYNVYECTLGKMSDQDFASKFLPGTVDKIRLPNSTFPAWKSLGLDRFRFFSQTVTAPSYEFFDGYTVTEVYLDTSLWNPFVQEALDLRNLQNSKLELIRTTSILTREFYDFWEAIGRPTVHTNLFEEWVVYRGEVRPDMRLYKMQRPSPTNDGNFGIGVVYNKKDDWQFRKFVSSGTDWFDFVLTTDERSNELFQTSGMDKACFPLESLPHLGGVTKLHMFDCNIDVLSKLQLGVEVSIHDYHNLNITDKLSVGLMINSEEGK